MVDFKSEIEMLVERYCEPAIMCFRPYGVEQSQSKSHVGGLPRLPKDLAWPSSSENVPLHFLAEIHLDELPKNIPQLPTVGVLYFFALIDEEMCWEARKPGSQYRVLYCEEPADVYKPAPDNLPPISGEYHAADRDFRLERERRTTVYPYWPLEFKQIRSWPDAAAVGFNKRYPTEFHWEFNATVRRERKAEVIRQTDWTETAERGEDWGEWKFDQRGKRVITLPYSGRGDRFPFCRILLDLFCRAAINNALKDSSSGKLDPAIQQELELLVKVATGWVRQYHAADPFVTLSKEELDAFNRNFSRFFESGEFEVYYTLKKALKSAVHTAVGRACSAFSSGASSNPPSLLFPRDVLSKCRSNHSPFNFHQMFGNAGCSQYARPIRRSDHLLLQLKSDNGADFMFCDCGEISFWIDHDHLQQGRFEFAWAETQGG